MSAYCTRANVEEIFGTESIEDYAKMSGDDTDAEILARITRAILVASAHIDAVLRKAVFQDLPIADTDGNTPTVIENLAAVMAGVWLYEAKGHKNFKGEGHPGHRLYYMARWARQMLHEIRDGIIQLDAR